LDAWTDMLIANKQMTATMRDTEYFAFMPRSPFIVTLNFSTLLF
jgi:hypothetical protein